MTQTTPVEAQQLWSGIRGEVLFPGDPRYDELRQAWNLSVGQHPAAITVARSAEDVSAAVRFAVSEGLGVAVQATGHGVKRPADGALLILTSQMRSVRVDADSRTAWVEAGAQWGAVLEATQAFGLAPLVGSSPNVGAVGYTLGGGMGWLARKYGLSADSVNYFELVTADGQVLRASQTENPDLFWGLRGGGGGGFGIVTGMEIRLYPVSTVYGGNLIYPVEAAREVLARYREWVASVPDGLTSSVVLMNFPPIPDVPEFLRGQSVVMVRGCYCGPIHEGEALLRHWREWRAPLVDDFKAMPFAQVASISNDPVNPIPAKSTGVWLRELADGAVDVLIQYAVPTDGPPTLMFAEVRHAGGAIGRVAPDDGAYSHRDAGFSLQMVGFTPSEDARRHFETYTDRFKGDLLSYLTGGVYINFLEGEEARKRTRDAYSPEAYRRLAALKARMDPGNVFNHGLDVASVSGS